MSLKPLPFKIGHQVEDAVSGFTGICTAITYQLSGTIQAHVQPKSSDPNAMSDTYAIDVEQIKEVVGGKHVVDLTNPAEAPKVKLGEKVRDLTSGFEGVVTALTVCFNGCIRATVIAKIKGSSKLTFDGRPPEIVLDHKNLEVIGAGVSEDAKKPVKPSSTGGPSLRFPARAVSLSHR